MFDFNKENEERALTILNTLKGMSIAEAQDLLHWCGERLLTQTVTGWGRTDNATN